MNLVRDLQVKIERELCDAIMLTSYIYYSKKEDSLFEFHCKIKYAWLYSGLKRIERLTYIGEL